MILTWGDIKVFFDELFVMLEKPVQSVVVPEDGVNSVEDLEEGIEISLGLSHLFHLLVSRYSLHILHR